MDQFTLSRLPFLAAFAIALVAMPCDVYAFNQRGLGVDHALPWTSRTSVAIESVAKTVASFRDRLARIFGPDGERGEIATDLLLAVPSSISARLRGLKQEKGELLKESQEMLTKAAVENRELSTEESAVDDKLHKRIATLNGEISRYSRLVESDRTAITELSSGSDGPMAGAIKNFGEFLQAVACASSPAIASAVPGGRDMVQKLAAYNAASGMSVGVPSDGGYLVRKDWTTALLDKARTEAVLLPKCKSIDIGGDFDGLEYPYIDEASRVDGSRWGGVQVFRNSEAAAVTAKQPKIGKGELRLEEITGLCYTTGRLLRDAVALNGLLGDAFSSEFAFKIDNEIVRGTGAGQCLGFLNSPALVTQAAEGGQTATTVNVDNVLKMYARMPARMKPGAAWFIHSDVMTQLPKMVIGQMPVWVPPGGLNNLPYGLLLGKPVIEIEQASALGSVGDIVFANLNEYVVIQKAGEGLMADTSMHVRFLNNEMTFRWVYRINGQPVARTAITPANGTSTLSAFVALAAR
jgi:HK97 family phage major capsid protein